jgi:hypothetical protein
LLRRVAWLKFTDIPEVLAVYVIRATLMMSALMKEAVNISETTAEFYQTTRRNNPEDSHLHALHCESLNVTK